MLIKADITELTADQIIKVIENHKKERDRYKRLKAYHAGEHDILNKQVRSADIPNNKIVSNYCEYITSMATGFFMGTPVTYTGAKEVLEALQDVFKYNDEAAHNFDLAETASIKGRAYELLYMDKDSNVRFVKLEPDEVILIADSSVEENLLYAIRYYAIKELGGDTETVYVDVYDTCTCTSYKLENGGLIETECTEHHFADVPFVEFLNNNDARSDFEGVMTIVDAYNKAQSSTLDDMEHFTDAFLVLVNMSGTDEEDLKKTRKDKVLLLEADGDAKWLIKDINDKWVENYKTRLQADIHKFSHIPDMSDEKFTGNTSGVAIKYKLIGLEQIRGRKERKFKKGLQRRLELIANIQGIKQAAFDWREVSITFSPNIPANIVELANIVTALNGSVSKQTLLSQLPFIPDPLEEMAQLKKEQDESLGGLPYDQPQGGENDESSQETNKE